MPRISILMPIYKTKEAHLCQAIESVLSQTETDFQLLILNDSPNEKYLDDLVAKYHDKRIKYFKNKENMGITYSHNRLLELATGKYLAVMDHDDVMYPDRLARQVSYMESNPQVGICGTAYKRFGLWNKRGVVRSPKDSDIIKAGLFFKCTMLHPSIMMRADVLKKYHISYDPDYISANDRRLFLDVMPYVDFYNLSEVLMKYRMHANMTSRTKRDEIVVEQKQLRQEMLAKIQVKLSNAELSILNDYALKGRCRIKDKNILNQVERVLLKINAANQKSAYFPTQAFSKLCAKYLVKRCLNAAFYGRISSKELLKKTQLPVQQVKVPLVLKICNFILPK